MGTQTQIAWTDHTFNPWMGCAKVSAGCTHCYAETLTRNRMGLDLWGNDAPRQRTSAPYWKQPLKWAKNAGGRVFCGSLCDVFEERQDLDPIRADLWGLIRTTPDLTWQLLTKRPDQIMRALPADWAEGYPNVWLGVTVEDSRVAYRIDSLRQIPARLRFVSYEPAIGPLGPQDLSGIGWLIYGGESGPKRRHDDIAWAAQAKRLCDEQDVAFFFKQRSGLRPGNFDDVPRLLSVQSFPP